MKRKSFIFLGVGLMFTFGGALIACNQETPQPTSSESRHEHKATGDWIQDSEGHYHKCECGEKMDYAAHTFATRTTTVTSSCTTPGFDQEETYCTVCGYVQSSTKKNIVDIAQHEYEEVSRVDATCTTPGYIEYKCKNCDETYRETINALGHEWQSGVDCDSFVTCKNCDSTKPGPGHHYDVKSNKEVTCTTDGETTYECHECGHQYTTVTKAEGHKLSDDLEFSYYKPVSGKECTYKAVYVGQCSTCRQTVSVEGEDELVRHTLITKYKQYPTCRDKGLKGSYCTVCKKYIGNMTEVDIDPNAHSWELSKEEGGVKTYQCSHCSKTKTVIETTDNKLEANADAVKNNEIAIQDVAMKFEDVESDSSNLFIKVNQNDAEDLYNISEEDYAKLEGRKVYDFTLYDGDASANVNFGKATVRIPYELQPGDDVDALVVYYIDSNTGELEAVNAKYMDGYAVFETEHFSFYCVTFMSPAERCAKYGHNWSEEYKVDGGCVSDSFTYHYCNRCHNMEYTSYTKAAGHKYSPNAQGSIEATCTKSGHTDYLCSVCGDHYGTDVPALGHDYKLDKEHSVEPNCTEAGSFTYVCDRCGESETGHSYTLTTAALGHQYEAQVTPATCIAEGSIKYICKVCGEEDTTRASILEKLDHKYEYDSETDSKIIYKCEVCGNTLEVAKSGTKSLDKDYAVQNDFFTDAAYSLVGQEIVSTGEFTLEINNGNKVNKFSYEDAEVYAGLDANGMFVAYGKVKVSNNDTTNVCAFYLKDNMLYTAIDERYYAVNLSKVYLDSGMDVSYNDLIKNIPNIIDFMKNEVKDYVDGILEVKGDEINETIYNVLDSLFDFETSVNGFNIKFSSEKFSNLIKTMKEKSLREVIEFVIGKDNVNKVLDRISEYSDVSYKKALEMFKEDTGIDYKELLELIDKGVAKFTEYESLKDMIQQLADIDIDEYLAEAYLETHTLVNLVKENNAFAQFFSNKTLAEFIEEYVKTYLDKTLEEIIDNDDAYKSFTDVLDIVEGVAKHAGITIRFKEDGSLLGVDLKVNASEEINENNSFTAKGNLSINFGGTPSKTYDYQNLKNLSDRIIKAANHDGGLDKALADSFSDSYKLTKDASGLITGVEHEEKYSNYGYYPDIDKNGYVYGTINNKRDVLNYMSRSYYEDLVGLVKEYGLDDYYIQIKNNGYSYKYYTPGINVTNISFNRTCGNSYDVNLSYATKYDYVGESFSLVLYGDGTDPVKTVTTEANKYTRNSNEYVRFTYNTANGKINAPNSGHEWLLSESMSHYKDVKCGDYEEYVYNCVNCGATKTELRYVDHKDVEIVKAEYIEKDEEKQSCYNGVIVTYKCHDCEQEYTEKTYGHTLVNEQVIDLKENLHIDTKLIISTCLCGDRTDYFIEGFKRINTYSNVNGHYYDYIFESEELKDGQATYIGIYTESQWMENCKYKRIMNIVSNIYGEEKDQFVRKVNLGEYESHSYSSFTLDMLTPRDANDLTKGFEAKFVCATCGKKDTRYYDANDYIYVYPKLDAKHSPSNGGYNFEIGGRAIDLYRGYIDNIWMSFYYCDFERTTLTDGTELYICRNTNYAYGYYDSSSEPTKCPFNYFIKRSQSGHDNVTCRDLTYNIYGIGCDEKGKNPLYTFKHITNSRSAHVLGEDKDLKTKTYADLGIVVSTETGNCKDCGKEVTNLILTRNDNNIYTTSKTVTKTNVTTYYPAGYSPATDTIEYSSSFNDENSVVITTKTNVTIVRKYFVADDLNNVRLIEERRVYDLSGNELSYYRSNKQYRADEGLVYSYTEDNKKYSMSIDETEFKAKFKEHSLFDYSAKDFGCVSFWENKEIYDYGDGEIRETVRVSDVRLDDHGSTTYHKGSCSQPSYRTCDVCGDVIYVSDYVNGHNFEWDNNRYVYVCSECGTHSDSSYSGSVVMEDCSSKDKSGKSLIVGYYFNYGRHYDLQEWDYTDEGYNVKVYLGGNYYGNTVVLDVDVASTGDKVVNHYIKISKVDIRKAVENVIKNSGYNYTYVAVSLVPEYSSYSDYNLYFGFDELGMTDLLPEDEKHKIVPTSGMAIVVNGQYYYSLHNDGAWDQNPEFTQYSCKEGIALNYGDIITFYNADTGDRWSTMAIDSYSEGSPVQDTNGILIREYGTYDIYLKLKYGEDNIYIGYHQ